MTTQADLMARGLKAGLDFCMSCEATKNLQQVGEDKYCPKHTEEIQDFYKKGLTKPAENELTKEQARALKSVESTKTLKKLMEDGVPPMSWRVDKFLPERGVVMIGAEAGSYKTYLAQYLALCIANGEDFLEAYPTKKGTVLYVDEENGEASLMRRFEQLKNGHEFDDYPENIFLTVYEDVKLDTHQGREIIDALIDRYDPDVIILDSMVRLMDGDENSSTDVREVFDTIKILLEEKPRCFVFLHHTRKNANGRMSDLRGSGDFSAMTDVVVMVDKKEKKPGFGLLMSKNRFIDTSRFENPYIAVRSEDEDDSPIRFENLGGVLKAPSRAENCLDDFKDWVTENNIYSFRSKDALNAMKQRGHSATAFYEMRLQAINEELITERKRGLYDVRPGRIIVEEQHIEGSK